MSRRRAEPPQGGGGRGGASSWATPPPPRLDQPEYVRTHHVARDVHPEPLPGARTLLRGGAEHGAVLGVVLVVGPVHDRVGPGKGNLDGAICMRADELELLQVVCPFYERLLYDRRLGVVLVVEGAYGPAGLEARRVPDGVVVHFAAALLAVVDHVEPRVLQEPDAVEGREVLNLLPVRIGETIALVAKDLGELLYAIDAEALAPLLRFLYV